MDYFLNPTNLVQNNIQNKLISRLRVSITIIILFNFGGIGTVWVEDQGTDAGSIPFIWHTNGSQLTLQLAGEDAVSATYSISDNTFNLLFSDGWELIYTKQ